MKEQPKISKQTKLTKENELKNTDDDLQIVSMNDIDKAPSTKMKKKLGRNGKIRIGVIVLSSIIFIFAAAQLISIILEYKKGDDEYNALQDYVSVDVNRDGEENVTDAAFEDTKKSGIMPYKKANVDFEGLKKVNSEVVGWIQFEHVSISYPIVQHSDNEYYLKKTFKKADNSAGSIFMESGNNSKLKDMNTFIYGHNMKNGSMFGLMGQYKKADFYTGRECFWIYTPNADYRYQIFSCYEPQEDSEMYTWYTGVCPKYEEYLKKAKSMSMYDTGVSVSKQDKIVTLSTCTSKGKTFRFVVQGKLIQTVPRQ